ncbi:MAG: gamma-glutamylcyclotransferase [Alphaproteobacteria bacterium]|nr:gamma-glutamylcyclotransferase [Alphaproteobacteria bacterium]
MPVYFAYGSNMDAVAMAQRCPRSKALGRARLMRHRFSIMAEGYATIERDPRSVVWGVLWEVALADMRALDAYESVATGLYLKIQQTVMLDPPAGSDGVSKQVRALVYTGRAAKGAGHGTPLPGYMENVIAAARAFDLPQAYIRQLEGFMAGGPRRALAASPDAAATRRIARQSRTRVADRDEAGNVVVRPRFASPLDGERQ